MKKTSIDYANVVEDDISGLVELEREVWGQMAAEEEKWASRINIYPQGTFVAKDDGKIIGVLVLHRLKWSYQEDEYPDWDEVTANGYITNHDNEGEVLYGVDMTVIDEYPGVAINFIEQAIILKKNNKIPRGLLGGRIPTLATYVIKHKLDEDALSPELVLAISKEDPLINFFCLNHFRAIAAKKNYYPIDDVSLGWGIILEVTK